MNKIKLLTKQEKATEQGIQGRQINNRINSNTLDVFSIPTSNRTYFMPDNYCLTCEGNIGTHDCDNCAYCGTDR